MKPILFNTDMVRAILDGTKTVTRRIVKPQPHLDECGYWNLGAASWSDKIDSFHPMAAHSLYNRSPYHVGDVLYVRETWTPLCYVDENGCTHYDRKMYFYAADGEPDITLCDSDGFELEDQRIRWHPSIHMPKDAARIFLRVKDVRIEKLQSIKTWQCVDEGAVKKPNLTKRGDVVCHDRYRTEFAALWNSTVKPAELPRYGWEANPWVWVIEFERCGKPEEETK